MALNVSKTQKSEFDYTPISERNEKLPFSVKFRVLDLPTLASIQDSALTIKDGKGYEINVNKQNLEALRHGLIGWSNISDGKAEIKFRLVHGLADMECLEYIPQEFRTEIGNIILEVSKDPRDAEALLSA
jgi:hypothetical protein